MEKSEIEYNASLKAVIAHSDTKTVLSDDYVKISWAEGDTISVYTNKGRFVNFIYDISDSEGVAVFKGVLEGGERITGHAVYPTGSHSVSEGTLCVNLPEKYHWKEKEVRAPLAADFSSSDEVVVFRHLGGVFAFDIKGVPAGASSHTLQVTSVRSAGINHVSNPLW